jgi:5,10-methenyltetrahydrofolate synthetase
MLKSFVDKSSARKLCSDLIKAIPTSEKQSQSVILSKEIYLLILEYIKFKKLKHINLGVFAPSENEVDICFLYQSISQIEKVSSCKVSLGLPFIKDYKSKTMEFCEIETYNNDSSTIWKDYIKTPLLQNQYGIYEVQKQNNVVIPDIVVCNALCVMKVDNKLYRIGYGGGFYDRYFQKHPQILKITTCFNGCAFVNNANIFNKYDVPIDKFCGLLHGSESIYT